MFSLISGKSSEKLTFLLDNEAELKVPVELEIYIKGLNEKQKGVKRFQRRKQYNAEEICFRDSLLNIIKGVRPMSNTGMKFQSVRLPAYEIPHRLLESCRGATRGQHVPTHSQMVENLKKYYGVLYEQLSEHNYMSKFHTCLFLEEICLKSHMANLEIAKGVLRHSGEYLALYVVGLMESRPSLIIGDRVYASVPDNVNIKEKATYEGFIHAIRHEELLIKFAKTFHDSYRGETYRFRFDHSRTQFRRLHYVLDDVMKPKLGVEWLFPRLVQEKAPVVDIIGEDQLIEKPEILNEKPETLTKKLKKIFPGDPDMKPVETRNETESHNRNEKEESVPNGKEDEQKEVRRESRNTSFDVSNEDNSIRTSQNTLPITNNQDTSSSIGNYNQNTSQIATNHSITKNKENNKSPLADPTEQLEELDNVRAPSISATAEQLALFNNLLNPNKLRGRQKVSPPKTGVVVNGKLTNGIDRSENVDVDEVSKKIEQDIVDGVSKVGYKLEQKIASNGNEVNNEILNGNDIREKHIAHIVNSRNEVSKTSDVVTSSITNEPSVPMEVQVAGNILQDTTNVEQSQLKPSKPTKEPTEMEKMNWGKTKRNSEVQWVRDFAGKLTNKENSVGSR
ncbi:hypothetical protein WDU94_004921 [Cyamophila willieti]